MIDVICYARTSVNVPFETSIDTQLLIMKEYCTEKKLNIISIIKDEGISASKPLEKRPGGERLVDLLENGQIKNVVICRLDRMFRSAVEALTRVSEWDETDIELHICNMGDMAVNTKSPMGKIVLTMFAAFAEFERSLISERTANAIEAKRKSGQVYNHLPYGFDRDGKKMIPNEKEQKIIECIFKWREEKKSLYHITEILNDMGVPAKKGGKWHAATIAHIVNNDLYKKKPDNIIEWNEALETFDVDDMKKNDRMMIENMK